MRFIFLRAVMFRVTGRRTVSLQVRTNVKTVRPNRNGRPRHSSGGFFYLVCEAIGTGATPGLLCQPRVIVKMIVEKQMECRLAGETEVLG
jgi:hypothetical protein